MCLLEPQTGFNATHALWTWSFSPYDGLVSHRWLMPLSNHWSIHSSPARVDSLMFQFLVPDMRFLFHVNRWWFYMLVSVLVPHAPLLAFVQAGFHLFLSWICLIVVSWSGSRACLWLLCFALDGDYFPLHVN